MDNAPEKTGWEPRLHSAHCAAVTEQEKTSSVTPPVGDLARSGSSRGPRPPLGLSPVPRGLHALEGFHPVLPWRP